jgi:hypothetical protein
MRRLVCCLVTLAACGGSKGGTKLDAGVDARPDAVPDAPPDAGPCPDEHGSYTITLTGAGCLNLNANAPQCITQNMCTITLVSTTTTGPAGLNGTAMLGMDGSFSNGAIREGTANRTGCTGTWDAATSTLTVDCGGMGTTQSCIATLTQTSKTCP